VKIVDARSGEVLSPGQTVRYGDGEKIKLIEVDEGLMSARALIESTYRDVGQDGYPLVTSRQWVTLSVRFTHPAFMFQRVAFIPS
jgi:hypothetical protein